MNMYERTGYTKYGLDIFKCIDCKYKSDNKSLCEDCRNEYLFEWQEANPFREIVLFELWQKAGGFFYSLKKELSKEEEIKVFQFDARTVYSRLKDNKEELTANFRNLLLSEFKRVITIRNNKEE